jgi:TonB family protein
MLLAQGHEAKSIASTLELSVHTVNERLRSARRKLGVSSSREAARLLLAQEGREAHKNSGHKEIRVARAGPGQSELGRSHSGATGAQRRQIWVMTGAVMLVIAVAILITTSAETVDRGAASNRLRLAEPITPIPSLFAVTDYPVEALAQHAEGITDYRLSVDENGRVEQCDIERSSGSAALDQATCLVITRRSRFHPAVDSAGRPAKSVYPGMIHWKL